LLHIYHTLAFVKLPVLEKFRPRYVNSLTISIAFPSYEKLIFWGNQPQIVKPILLYGGEIWGFGNIDIIERVHLKFCKLILNLKKSTPNFMIYGELGDLHFCWNLSNMFCFKLTLNHLGFTFPWDIPMSVYIELRMINFLVKNGKWKG
jgi:hypothetical protein